MFSEKFVKVWTNFEIFSENFNKISEKFNENLNLFFFDYRFSLLAEVWGVPHPFKNFWFREERFPFPPGDAPGGENQNQVE